MDNSCRPPRRRRKRDIALALAFTGLIVGTYLLPTGFEKKVDRKAVRCRGLVLETDNSQIFTIGMIRQGDQTVRLRLLDGPFAGREVEGNNPVLGQMDRDKIFRSGDEAMVVLTLTPDGEIAFVNPQEHYRIGAELFLLGIFALLMVAYARWVGVKALLSFLFAAMLLWKVLVPLLLKGWDPVLLAFGVVTLLCGVVIFLVAGITRKGVVAFFGSLLGVLTSCLLALYFTGTLHIRGAVLPFAETLLYSGYGHLDLEKIYVAAVFIACSGAVMDLAMDVSASMGEVIEKHPAIGRHELIASGFTVGRAVVGTMTTTLLLAYSGGYITMLMAFMARGVPLVTTFNLIYVAAETAKTLVGSFGMVTVAPFTAIIGGFVYTWRRPGRAGAPGPSAGSEAPGASVS